MERRKFVLAIAGTTFGIENTRGCEMKNPFHEIEEAIKSESADAEELMRALMSTIYLECCEGCSDKLRSEEFVESFRHMLREMKVCHDLMKRTAA